MRFPIALMILIGTAVPAFADMESARNALRAGNPAEMTALAASGDDDAQLLLAEAYMAAAGVARDPARAVIWAKKAATQGNLLAQVMLAQVFGEGPGVEKDPAESARWLVMAAAQGDAESQFDLATR